MNRLVSYLVLLSAALIGCSKNPEDSKPLSAQSVLFVGNSFTSWNGGLERLLDDLAVSIDSDSQLFTAAITVDGSTLEKLWKETDAHSIIQKGAYEVLVIQGDIPEGDVSSFHEYAKKFISAAKKSGTRPILLMGWAYDRLNWISQDEIAQAHYQIAQETGVHIAPVGVAWSWVEDRRPDINLYADDREHPSLAGSYLTACVLYATIMSENPEGAGLPPEFSTDRETARFLQQAAWDIVKRQN